MHSSNPSAVSRRAVGAGSIEHSPAARLFVFLIGFAALAPLAFGATWTSNGTFSDLRSKCAGSRAGDTVTVPSGSYTWGTSGAALDIPHAITIAGAGPGQTVITVDGSAASLFTIESASKFTGFTFVCPSSGRVIFTVNGTDGSQFTDLYFDNSAGTDGGYFIKTNHCYTFISNVAVFNRHQGSNEFFYGTGHSGAPYDGFAPAWQIAENPGDSGLVNGVPAATYIENSSFYDSGYPEYDGNGRFVVRYCTFEGLKIDLHGYSTDFSPSRGGRMLEAYNNVFIGGGGADMELRGGTGVWFNNATGYGWWYACDYGTQGYVPNFDIAISHHTGRWTGVSGSATVTTGTSCGLPSKNGIGPVQVTCSAASLSGTYMVNVSGNTLTIVSKVNASGGFSGNADNTLLYIQTPYNYPLQDQVGRGPDRSGPFTGAAAAEPFYAWGNLAGASRWGRTPHAAGADGVALYKSETGTSRVFTDNDIVQEGRDLFCDVSGFAGSLTPCNDVRVGLLSARPSIAETNQAYWATDANTLYYWTSGGWAVKYRPFRYPYVATSAPTVTSPTIAFGTTNAPFSYTLSATNNPTSYSATTLPSWAILAYNSSAGAWQVTGTCPSSPANFTANIAATNASGTGYSPLVVLVSATPPSAPAITSASTASAKVGVPFSGYRITASNAPTSFGASALPPGLSVDSATGLISGTPTSTQQNTNFFTSTSIYATQNNLAGYVGITFTPTSAATVTQLGRWVVSGNSGTHTLYLIDNTEYGAVLGTVTVNASGAAAGAYLYGTLAPAVILSAGHQYTLVSSETDGGDTWGNNQGAHYAMTMTWTPIAGWFYAISGASLSSLTQQAYTNQPLGPTNFVYHSTNGVINSTISATNAGGTGHGNLTFDISGGESNAP
jgi:hypothetical protein